MNFDIWHDQTEATDGDRTRQREGWPSGNGDAPKPLKIADVLRAKRDCAPSLARNRQ